MKPGEIYMADLEAVGRRPVVVVSREELNRGDYVVVVMCTSAKLAVRSKLPNCVPFRTGEFGFTKDCVAQCEAILFIEKARIDFARGTVGQLDDNAVRDVIKAVGYVLASDCEPA